MDHLGSPIASGRTAQIFRTGEDRVLKLYETWVPRGAVESECLAMKLAAAAGLPVPEPGEVADVDGRFGFEMPFIAGQNGMERLYGGAPIEQEAVRTAKLQAAVHRAPGKGLPPTREKLAWRIQRCDLLSPPVKKALEDLLDGLPDRTAFLHGDFHPANVIGPPEAPWIVDWVDASCGDPAADVARSLVLFGEGVAARAGEQNNFRTAYLSAYRLETGSSLPRLQDWLTVCRAARLWERAERNPESLLELIEAALRRKG